MSELVNLTRRNATPRDVERARAVWESRWPRWFRRLWLWAHGWKMEHVVTIRADMSQPREVFERIRREMSDLRSDLK